MPDKTPPKNTRVTTEAELRAVTIGALQPLVGKVLVVEYDPNWPQQFALEASKIRAALGERALLLGRVGSTSVPGLAAKPILDILLGVANSAVEASYVPALEHAGYVLRIREPEWFEHRVLKGVRSRSQYACVLAGIRETERMLLMRDWLRAPDDDRELYARAKRELAGEIGSIPRTTPTPRLR